MKKSGVIWGIMLILLGTVILLRSFGILYFSWWSLWKIWPLIFVFIGISILPAKGWVKSLLYTLTVAAGIGLMVYLEQDNPHRSEWRGPCWNWDKEHVRAFKKELRKELQDSDQTIYFNFTDSVETVHVDANLLPGEYTFKGKTSNNSLQCYFAGSEYFTSFRSEGRNGFVDIVPDSYEVDDNEGKIYLDEQKSYVFNVMGESSKINMDLFRIRTDTLRIDAGAESEWEITLSNHNPETLLHIQAEPGAEIAIVLPTGMGYRMVVDKAPQDEPEQNDTLAGKQVMKSDDFDTAATKLLIVSDTEELSIRRK